MRASLRRRCASIIVLSAMTLGLGCSGTETDRPTGGGDVQPQINGGPPSTSTAASARAAGHPPRAGNIPPGSGSGYLHMALTDSPSDPKVTAVYVCIQRVDIVFSDDQPIATLDVSRTINLLDLRNGVTASLGIAQLPVGVIQQIRLILCPDGASAVIDGEQVSLKVPSGSQTGIKLTRPGGFVVSDSVTTTVIVDFDAAKSLHYAPGQGWMLTPVVKLLEVAILLAVTSPAPGACVKPTFTVKGTVASQAPLVSVIVNGVAATVTGVDFSVDVTVPEGPATVLVRATDVLGREALVTLQLTADGTPPVVLILSPENGALVTTAAVDVTGTVSDACPVTVSVNSVAATVAAGGFTAPQVPITAGVDTITASATDAAGNTSEVSIAVAGDVNSAGEVLDAAGGTVTTTTGPLAGTTMNVPAGALTAPTTVGFTLAQAAPVQAAGFAPIGPVVQVVAPTGTVFAKDVTIALPFSMQLVTAFSASSADLGVTAADPSGGSWSLATDVTVNFFAGKAEVGLLAPLLVQPVAMTPPNFTLSVIAGCHGSSCQGAEGGDGVATTIPLGAPWHTTVDTAGIVYFVERASDASASRLRKVKDGQLTTVTSVPAPGRIDGLALDFDSLLFLSVAPASGGGVASTVYLGWVDPSSNAVTLLASLDLGESYASGLAKDPRSNTIYYADPALCTIMAGAIRAGVFGGQAPAPVAGTLGAGCGDNRHQNPAPSDPATNTDPSVGPALATNVQLDLPYDVAYQPVSVGGGLLFITDVGNRRVLVLNTAGVALTVGNWTVPPGTAVALAGADSSTAPSGVTGNPPSTLGLCGPAAAAMVGGVLAFTDNCSPPSPTKASILLVDFALGGASPGWTSFLGHDYHDAAMVGEFLPTSPTQGLDSLMLGGSLGLARGGPSKSLYVTDFVNRGVYEIAYPPLPAGMPSFTSATWDNVAAPDLGRAAEAVALFSTPASAQYLARQQGYLEARAQQLPQWRAAGLTDAQIAANLAALKLQWFGQ